MTPFIRSLVKICIPFVFIHGLFAKTEVEFLPNSNGMDQTIALREALDDCEDSEIKLILSKGRYFFKPDYAYGKYCAITNHGNGWKKIIFPFENFKSVEIEGNGAELIFHGQAIPFLFENCQNVTVHNLSIDWDVPFTFSGEVIATNEEEGWRDIKPFTKGFSWKLHNGELKFPNIDGFNYSILGSTLAFDPNTKAPVHNAADRHSNPTKVEKLENGVLRFHEHLKQYPPVGSILNSKGNREDDRYGPALHVKSSHNIVFENVVVHHALGMGFLMERTENAHLKHCGVYLKPDTDRVISSTADATHFCNCKGDILVENCRFENMLDDGTNVHGTYVEVDSVLNDHTVRCKFKHFEQSGYVFGESGDEVWLIQQPNPQRSEVNRIQKIQFYNEQYVEIEFVEPLPVELTQGDIIENKTWNPTFTMRGCTIRNHRARNIVLKTPLKTLIEDNHFSSMMSSIFFRGETYFWFESGAVQDVTIRNNHFNYCAYSHMEHAVLTITPRLGKAYNQTATFDRNIRFENNTIHTFDNRIVWADRVDELTIANNTIIQTQDHPPMRPDAHMFDFKNCKNVSVTGNTYTGNHTKTILADPITQQSLKVTRNTGFQSR